MRASAPLFVASLIASAPAERGRESPASAVSLGRAARRRRYPDRPRRRAARDDPSRQLASARASGCASGAGCRSTRANALPAQLQPANPDREPAACPMWRSPAAALIRAAAGFAPQGAAFGRDRWRRQDRCRRRRRRRGLGGGQRRRPDLRSARVRSLSAAVNGGGEIRYSGNPQVSSAIHGGGAVHRGD